MGFSPALGGAGWGVRRPLRNTKLSVSQIRSRLASYCWEYGLGSEEQLFAGLDLDQQGHQRAFRRGLQVIHA